MKNSVFVGLTMKSMDYFEGGLPIINNIHGDTWDMIDENGIGVNISFNTGYKNFGKYDIDTRKKVRSVFEKAFSKDAFNNKVVSILGDR